MHVPIPLWITLPFSFKDAMEFSGNDAKYGGGLAVEGGKVT